MTFVRYGQILRGVALCCVLALFWCAHADGAHGGSAVVVLDGSRSMWGQVAGKAKYMHVHDAFTALPADHAEAVQLGLVTYGNNSPSSCSDVHVAARPEAAERQRFLDAIATLSPLGMTPLARALESAGELLGQGITERNLLVIADGADNCRGDPCAAAARIAREHPGVRIDLITLNMPEATRASLACLWETTGGTLRNVTGGAELDAAVAGFVTRITASDAALAAVEMPIAPDAPAADARGDREDFAASEDASELGSLPNGVFTYPDEHMVAPPPPRLAQPGVEPPLPQINPFWQDKLLAQLRPPEKPFHLGDPADFVPMEDMPPDFAPVDISDGPAVAEAEEQAVDPIETGSVSEQASELETVVVPDAADAEAPGGAATATLPDAPAGTDGAPEVDIRTEPHEGRQGLHLHAKLTAAMNPISRPVQWTVFAIDGEERALWPQVAAVRAAAPEIALPAGEYLVEVRYGHVVATMTLSVVANEVTDATFVLNAGGLRILSQLVFLDAPPDERAVHYIYSGATDENGMRELIARSQIQGEIIRLNAGRYHVISRLGSANAVVETDVTVNPGVLTAVEINHKAGVVRLAVVAGEEMGSGDLAVLQILDRNGNTVAEMHGLSGDAILAPGTYTAVAESAGRRGRREFEIRIGEAMSIDLTLR